MRPTHLALGSILTHFRFIGLGKFRGVVILIQNFNVNLHNGFFTYRVTCRRDSLLPSRTQLILASEDVWVGSPGAMCGGDHFCFSGGEAQDGVADGRSFEEDNMRGVDFHM